MAAPDTTDPRVERSRAQLLDALAALLARHEARDISVSALCAEAGVSRPTFYQHFASVDEVAVASIERRFRDLKAALPPGPDDSTRLLVAFLSDLDAQRAEWRRTIGSGAGLPAARDAVEAWFAARLADRHPDQDPVAVRYAAAGFLGAVRAWLLEENDAGRQDPEVLAARLVELAGRVLRSPSPPAG